MSVYTKTTFINASAPGISAAELNKIGDGIADAHSELTSHEAGSTGNHAGTDLSDFGGAAPSTADVWRFNGTIWVPAALAHADLATVSGDQHHLEAHDAQSTGPHTGSGLTAGHALRATSGTAFSFGQVQHGDLGGVTPDTHHARDHALSGSTHTGDIPIARATGGLVHVSMAGPQTITTATETQMVFDIENNDDWTGHSTSVNSGRINDDAAGVYHIALSILWASSATGDRLIIIKKGTLIIAQNRVTPFSGDSTLQHVCTTVRMTGAEFLEARVLQASGGNLDVSPGGRTSHFAMTKVGS